MKKRIAIYATIMLVSVSMITGCTKEESTLPEPQKQKEVKLPQAKVAVIETVEVDAADPLAYLPVVAAEASSFDQTPDWAPEPDPMAPTDGDMLTRWSSDYIEGIQWISFDLGSESVISNMIIRWERAHATDYTILVSTDGKSWKEVYHETNGKSGSMEATFTPVKARYVKVRGDKRVNDDWGISIWEAEIYGPKSKNDKATILKADYLSKGADEESRKEADELLVKFASAVTPISEKPFQKGVVYTSWMADELMMPASDIMLVYLKELGIDTISIMVPAYQQTIESKVIFTNDKPEGDTPTDEALKHAIASCHKIGLRVMLKPHVDPRTDEARINIVPSEEWFDSFEAFTVRYAKLAEETGCEMFSVGTELEATTFSAWAARWNQVIDKTKEVYSGLLTYSANWTEYKEVPFWDRMDFIGIDAYFPLAEVNDNPTLEELTAKWEKIADEIEAWRKEKGLEDKGVILTEIGYPSADGAARQPWVAISRVEDQQEQADCLEATFQVLHKRSWFEGYYLWQYFPQDRWSPLGFTIKGKKSEEVVKRWVKGNGTLVENVTE